MADYIKYDAVTGRILEKYKSVDGSNLVGDILKIDRETFDALTIYKKVFGDAVVDMNQTEKDEVDAEIAQAQADELQERLDKFEVSNLDLITALIKRINVRIPANPITKTEMIQQLRDDMGL